MPAARPGSISRLIAAMLLLVAAWIGHPATAHAQTISAGVPIAVCVRPVRADDSARAMLATTRGFDCHTPQTRFGSGDFWVRAAALPAIPDATRLRVTSTWQAHATLWIAYADGVVRRVAIDDVGMTRRVQLGAIIEQPLPVRAARAVALLWKVEGAGNLLGIVVAPRLATPAQSAHANLTLALLYGAFIGMCVALFIYNIAIWAALRHRFQLVYCAMVAMLTLYAISSSGLLAWMMPDIANTTRLRVNYLALGGAGATALLFARCFFENRVFTGWLGRAVPIVAAMLFVSAALFALLSPWRIAALNRAYVDCFVLEMALVVPILWQAWRRRSNFLWLFSIAWAAPIALATLRVAGNLGLMRWSFLLDNSTLAAMTVESLMSSLAIAYRIRLLSVERDDAREQELAARALADSDPLTGLANRRAFLREAIGRGGDQILLLADIDHFKHVNDTIGHDGGDDVLRIVARALSRAAPADALVARLGGEEFAIVASADAGLGAPEVLAAVRGQATPFDIPVTISIGLCHGTLATEADWKTLYNRADRALFAAKAAGRDRARYADRPVAA